MRFQSLFSKERRMNMKKKVLMTFLGLNAGLFCYMFPTPKKRAEKPMYDCAIVCGYFANEDGTPSDYMKTRVEEGVRLWKERKVRCLILSGAAVRNEHVEAEIMKAYALSLGAPEECIYEEKQAVSTYHNMLYAKEIMEREGLESCAVVTNGWHLRKANHYARKFDLDYVMCEAKNPDGESKLLTLWRNVSTNLHMYGKMFRGYY